MIALFSLSQMSNLAISLFQKNGSEIGYCIDSEETEQFKNIELEIDGEIQELYFSDLSEFHLSNSIHFYIKHFGHQSRHKALPETPPPDFV